MALSLQSRVVGDVTVVTCHGRIVEGVESAPLQKLLADLVASPNPYIVLDFGGVDFIDSAGLGLLVRFLTRTRAAGGHLALCAVPAKVSEVLRMTRLAAIFESYASEAEAIAASYRSASSAGAPSRFSTDILCVDKSVDVQCYVREVLAQAGYGVLTAGNLPDALVLLQAARPKVVVIGAELRSLRNTQTAERFNGLADARPVVELPSGFSKDDAGIASRRLLDQIRSVAGEGRGPASA
jgi:anti-sigma B factor antagonist